MVVKGYDKQAVHIVTAKKVVKHSKTSIFVQNRIVCICITKRHIFVYHITDNNVGRLNKLVFFFENFLFLFQFLNLIFKTNSL